MRADDDCGILYTGFHDYEPSTVPLSYPTMNDSVLIQLVIYSIMTLVGYIVEVPEEPQQSAQDIQSLLNCKICFSRAVGSVFLNCGHMGEYHQFAYSVLRTPLWSRNFNDYT